MTMAVCFQCGGMKFGAFTPCQECGVEPRSDDALALSIAMTDHFHSESKLRRMGQGIKEGNPPTFSEDEHREMLETLRKLRSDPVFAQMMEAGREPSQRADVE